MAKFEEADERWIVKDLGDQGQNVNNWHWREYEALEWSQQRLRALFLDVDLLAGSPDSGNLTVTDVICKGEAIINNRKNKLIPAYELDLTLKWTGKPAGSDASVVGRVLLPYISDENHDEKPEIRFSSETEDAASQSLREAFYSKAQSLVVSKINEFVAELRAGGPVKPGSTEASQEAGSAAGQGAGPGSSSAERPKLSSAAPEAVKPRAAPKPSFGRTTLALKESYYARPSDIFECFVIEGKVKAFTQSAATVEARPGGCFSWFNGSVTGEFLELETDQRIVMKWRFNTWTDGCFSKVVILLSSPEPGTTILTLDQTDIPHEDKFGQPVIETTENGWKNLILNRIRQVFGYGV